MSGHTLTEAERACVEAAEAWAVGAPEARAVAFVAACDDPDLTVEQAATRYGYAMGRADALAESARSNELRDRVVAAALDACREAEVEMMADELEKVCKGSDIEFLPRGPSRVYSRLRLLIAATRELRDAGGST